MIDRVLEALLTVDSFLLPARVRRNTPPEFRDTNSLAGDAGKTLPMGMVDLTKTTQAGDQTFRAINGVIETLRTSGQIKGAGVDMGCNCEGYGKENDGGGGPQLDTRAPNLLVCRGAGARVTRSKFT